MNEAKADPDLCMHIYEVFKEHLRNHFHDREKAEQVYELCEWEWRATESGTTIFGATLLKLYVEEQNASLDDLIALGGYLKQFGWTYVIASQYDTQNAMSFQLVVK